MAGSVEQSAFVITATLWSQGRAAVSPGGVRRGVTEGAARPTRGQSRRPGGFQNGWCCSMSPFSAYLKTPFHRTENIRSFFFFFAEQWHESARAQLARLKGPVRRFYLPVLISLSRRNPQVWLGRIFPDCKSSPPTDWLVFKIPQNC